MYPSHPAQTAGTPLHAAQTGTGKCPGHSQAEDYTRREAAETSPQRETGRKQPEPSGASPSPLYWEKTFPDDYRASKSFCNARMEASAAKRRCTSVRAAAATRVL